MEALSHITQDGQPADTQQVNFHQPHALDGFQVELGDDHALARHLGGHQVGQPPRSDNHASGMD